MNDREQLIENLKAIEGYFMRVAVSLRDSDPRESFRMFRCNQECRKAKEELEKQIPVKAELEGGGSTWWVVCGDCHGAIDESDRFCRHCGRLIEWDGMKLERKPD